MRNPGQSMWVCGRSTTAGRVGVSVRGLSPPPPPAAAARATASAPTLCAPPPQLIEAPDLVTEMTLRRHPFREQGVRAQAGIEY